jgi:hypothetical protein
MHAKLALSGESHKILIHPTAPSSNKHALLLDKGIKGAPKTVSTQKRVCVLIGFCSLSRLINRLGAKGWRKALGGFYA